MIVARKVKLTVVSNDREEAFQWIRQEMRNQNKALNLAMSHLYWCYVGKQKLKLIDDSYSVKVQKLSNLIEKAIAQQQNAKEENTKKKYTELVQKRKEQLKVLRQKKSKEVFEQFSKIIGASEQTSIRDVISSQFDLSSDTKDRLCQIVHQDFNNDIQGLLLGERSVRNYKSDNPLYVRGRSLNLHKDGEDFLIKWIKGVTFKCILRSKNQNSTELYKTLERIISEEYKICDSSIQFNRNNHLILNLTLDMPESERTSKISGRVVGVDLGLKIPAYVALNDDPYPRLTIGSIDNFLKVRMSIQRRRRNLYKALNISKGGRGRSKKLQALDRFQEKEKNFVRTYNHKVSDQIVRFAKKYQAETIHLELLRMKDAKKEKILRNWSYYELQQFIEYKAQREGLTVKYVDPYHTSQTCSKCDHYEEGQRISQERFVCKKCDFKCNADFNAARNIAMSKKFITSSQQSEYYKRAQ